MRRAWLALVVIVWLSGCAYYSLVQPTQRDIGGAYRVDPQIAWSAHASGKVDVWTVDGRLLESLEFYEGLEPGATLLSSPEVTKETPRYRAGMRANDIADLVIGTLEVAGNSDVTLGQLRPAPFGRWSGFRFDFSYKNPDGLAYEGLGLGGVDDHGRLQLILYTGTREHYFAKYRDVVEKLFASVQPI
jgi:hypothetical protein